jgi:hypothetical protein
VSLRVRSFRYCAGISHPVARSSKFNFDSISSSMLIAMRSDQPSYLLFSPLIYLLTPSNAKSLQSVLFALQAPVLYDDELAKSKGVSKGFVKHMPRSDGIRGGSIIRNCESYA